MSSRALSLLMVASLAACDRRDLLDRLTQPPAVRSSATGAAAAEAHTYQCPMHPQIVRDQPGTCPICGMTLQLVDQPEPLAREGGVPGHAPFHLSANRQQLIGVTRATVEVRPLVREIRTAATIANDPALYQAITEYREAVRTRAAIGGSSVREAHDGARAMVTAALLKLRRQGIDERQLAVLERTDPTTLILPGAQAWVYVQVYEDEAPLVTPGSHLTIEVPSLPGRTFEASVFGVDPTVNPTTRTVRVRALVATPDRELRPDAYATATIRVALGDRLAVPREAVLDSGTRRLVFVIDGDGTFTPHEVQLGRAAQGYFEVLDGVKVGDQVATSANFLIDSESRFRSAIAAFGPTDEPAHAH